MNVPLLDTLTITVNKPKRTDDPHATGETTKESGTPPPTVLAGQFYSTAVRPWKFSYTLTSV